MADLAKDEDRNLILVTATPHSGNEDAFRSLLSLIDTDFANLPPDLESDERAAIRQRLSKHLVQRLRANVLEFDKELGTDTSFPDREDKEEHYKLTKEYDGLFKRVHAFAGELVADDTGTGQQKRVRWWSALALLRAIASSPAAAAATLRSRAIRTDENMSLEDVDQQGKSIILDDADTETVEVFDGDLVHRLHICQLNGKAFGPTGHGAADVQMGRQTGSTRQDETAQRFKVGVHSINLGLKTVNLGRGDAQWRIVCLGIFFHVGAAEIGPQIEQIILNAGEGRVGFTTGLCACHAHEGVQFIHSAISGHPARVFGNPLTIAEGGLPVISGSCVDFV